MARGLQINNELNSSQEFFCIPHAKQLLSRHRKDEVLDSVKLFLTLMVKKKRKSKGMKGFSRLISDIGSN